MNLPSNLEHLRRTLMILLFLGLNYPFASNAQQPTDNPHAEKPYIEEWVYRVRYGFKDEWWKLFQKYQLAVLDKEKELGYVREYGLYVPSLHTPEETRWDYRLIIVFASQPASTHASEIEKQLFPDLTTFRTEEARRWELTANHWDLPIHLADPHASLAP
ncbi:MAG: hypothetical protein ACHQET_00700 [Chitinophagales bacterium]